MKLFLYVPCLIRGIKRSEEATPMVLEMQDNDESVLKDDPLNMIMTGNFDYDDIPSHTVALKDNKLDINEKKTVSKIADDKKKIDVISTLQDFLEKQVLGQVNSRMKTVIDHSKFWMIENSPNNPFNKKKGEDQERALLKFFNLDDKKIEDTIDEPPVVLLNDDPDTPDTKDENDTIQEQKDIKKNISFKEQTITVHGDDKKKTDDVREVIQPFDNFMDNLLLDSAKEEIKRIMLDSRFLVRADKHDPNNKKEIIVSFFKFLNNIDNLKSKDSNVSPVVLLNKNDDKKDTLNQSTEQIKEGASDVTEKFQDFLSHSILGLIKNKMKKIISDSKSVIRKKMQNPNKESDKVLTQVNDKQHHNGKMDVTGYFREFLIDTLPRSVDKDLKKIMLDSDSWILKNIHDDPTKKKLNNDNEPKNPTDNTNAIVTNKNAKPANTTDGANGKETKDLPKK